MPRLIPRLLESLKATANTPAGKQVRPIYPASRGRVSLRQPVPPSPDFSSSRTRSILLDQQNPVLHPKDFVQHKSLPPRVRLHRNHRKRVVERDGTVGVDVPREMLAIERQWWANPYLRMLSTPLRRCTMTMQHLPTDFLIRLSPRRITPPRTSSQRTTYALLPDGLEHPKFKNLYSRKGIYISCRRDVLPHLNSLMRAPLDVKITPTRALPFYVSHLLRLRVLQDLEILTAQLEANPVNAESAPLLRRLTRRELKAIRETNIIPFEGAVAVLIVPPVNRDPSTKEHVAPHASSLPEHGRVIAPITPTSPQVSSLPVSVLHPSSSPEDYDSVSDFITPSQIPLYNGASLFPSKGQRAALHGRLSKLLLVERRARYKQHGRINSSDKMHHPQKDDKWARGDEKASHAFLLCSTGESVKRADAVPLAIALWRLRMWEKHDWENNDKWASII